MRTHFYPMLVDFVFKNNLRVFSEWGLSGWIILFWPKAKSEGRSKGGDPQCFDNDSIGEITSPDMEKSTMEDGIWTCK